MNIPNTRCKGVYCRGLNLGVWECLIVHASGGAL